jgi:hypothetical protein
VEHLEWKMIGGGDDGADAVVVALIESGLAMEKDDPCNWDTKKAIYRATLNDLPADLMETAFFRCVKSTAFFPQVAVFRKFVEKDLADRAAMLWRAKRIRDLILNPPQPNGGTFVQEPPHVRLAGMIASYTRNNMPGRAAAKIAELWALSEGEAAKDEPAAWAVQGYVDVTLSNKDPQSGKWVESVYRVDVVEPVAEVEPEKLRPGIVEPGASLADVLASASDETADDLLERPLTRPGDPNEPPPRQEHEGGAQALDW